MPPLKEVAVVDYGMGNLRSVAKAAEFSAPENVRVRITQSADDIHNADAIIFPGQGAARACMNALHQTGMEAALIEAAKVKPFLGICMGLQILMTHSDENDGVDCLNICPGDVTRFDLSAFPELKLPHMGWNQIKQTQPHPLWHKIPQNSRFYFVHSYYVTPQQTNVTVGKTTHGQTFTSAIASDQVFAIQAHPEKSADSGLQLFKNFLGWNGQL